MQLIRDTRTCLVYHRSNCIFFNKEYRDKRTEKSNNTIIEEI